MPHLSLFFLLIIAAICGLTIGEKLHTLHTNHQLKKRVKTLSLSERMLADAQHNLYMQRVNTYKTKKQIIPRGF